MFGRKKEIDTITVMHYEGLTGHKQDFPVSMILGEEFVIFQNGENVAKLPYDRIITIDSMTEQNFMAKYHNNKAKTKHGTVWFKIITYTASTGEEKYIALWDVSVKAEKFFAQLEARIRKEPTETIL